MNTLRMIKAIGYIDDDLVSDAVVYKGGKRSWGWMKYVSVAACLAIVVFSVVCFRTPGVKSPIEGANNENTAHSVNSDSIIINAASSSIQIMFPRFSAEDCSPMSQEELSEYYGIDLRAAVPSGYYETSSSYPHGLYTVDEQVFDMNVFFYTRDENSAETLELCIGKETECSQYISGSLGLDEDAELSTINNTEMYLFHFTGADGETGYYACFQYNDCDLTLIGYNIDEQVLINALQAITQNSSSGNEMR